MASTGQSSPYMSAHEYSDVPDSRSVTAVDTPIEGAHDSDSEDAWDEVDVHADNSAAALAAATAAAGSKELSITIATNSKGKGKKKKPDGSITKERMIRQQRHRAHACCHLALGLIRNRIINDKEMQARLLSKVPLQLQNSFFTFSKQTHPQEWERIRLFDDAMKKLLDWWYDHFRIQDDKGLKRRNPTEVDKELAIWSELGTATSGRRFPWENPEAGAESQNADVGISTRKGKEKGKQRAWGPSEDTWEALAPGDIERHIEKLRGSRDLSALLFTCLCRGLDVPARLVFSLQPIDWRPPSATDKKIARKRGAGQTTDGATSDSDISSKPKSAPKNKGQQLAPSDGWRDGHGNLSYTVPKVNLRRTKKPTAKDFTRSPSPDPVESSRPPVFWTEVWSRYQRKWIPVDPYRRKYRCKDSMEPARTTQENQLLYAVAFEEDGSVRDVTPRYVKSYNNYTAKARAPSRKNTDWFAALLLPFHRTFELNRDREEHKELWDSVHNEPFPTSLGGFKNHPNYVLEQHLHRDEMIRPGTKQLGLFKGTEAVFPRSAVVTVKSKENYWRVGRVVKDNEIPMKWVKARTVTINKKRAENLARMEGEAQEEQPLYAQDQTVLYMPPPVIDGKIPKNDFGNIDLYVPSMLPAGAIHLTSKQAAKCAKALGIDYADAITGFEFRQRRANPVITGIVVAEEMADTLIGAIIEMEQDTEEKEFAKLQARCLKRWKTLILGLRIRQRVNAAYAEAPREGQTNGNNESQFATKGKRPATDRTPSSSSSSSETSRAPPRKRQVTHKKTRPVVSRATKPTQSQDPAPQLHVTPNSPPIRSLRLKMPASQDSTPPQDKPVTRASTTTAPKDRPDRIVDVSETQSDASDSDDLLYESDF